MGGRRQPTNLSGVTAEELIREGRDSILNGNPEKAAQDRRNWQRILELYGPSGSSGLQLDLSLPLTSEVVEAIVWAELRAFGIDKACVYGEDSDERLPVSTFKSALACLDYVSQMEQHPPAFTAWCQENEFFWKKIRRGFLTLHARNAATPIMLDELMRLSAWLMEPTPQKVRSAGLVALALDPMVSYENGQPVSWAWLRSLRVEAVVDLGHAGMRLCATDRVDRTVVVAPGATADAVRAAVATRWPPLRDDSGRTVVVDGVVQRVSYRGPVWGEAGQPMTGQGIRDHVAAIVDRVVPDVARITVRSGVTELFRVDDETRERAIMRAGEPSSDRLRDAAWLANAWWCAARGLEMLSRRVEHAQITDEGVVWQLPRKMASDGRQPFFGVPHLIDGFVDPRQLMLWWRGRLQEEWLAKLDRPLPDDAPLFPNVLSRAGIGRVPRTVGTPNTRLRRYVAEYNAQAEPEFRLEGHFTTHSLRIGFAICGRVYGLPTETVMMAGDWKDHDSWLMYMRRVGPLLAGEAGLSMAVKAGLSGVSAEQGLQARVRALLPATETGRLCQGGCCLNAGAALEEPVHRGR